MSFRLLKTFIFGNDQIIKSPNSFFEYTQIFPRHDRCAPKGSNPQNEVFIIPSLDYRCCCFCLWNISITHPFPPWLTDWLTINHSLTDLVTLAYVTHAVYPIVYYEFVDPLYLGALVLDCQWVSRAHRCTVWRAPSSSSHQSGSGLPTTATSR